MVTNETRKQPMWWAIAAIVLVLLLLESIHSEPEPGSSARIASSKRPNAAALSSQQQPLAGAYMDARERELYASDPSSMGYTEEDRESLKEHGVSETEARAAETVMHQQGVE